MVNYENPVRETAKRVMRIAKKVEIIRERIEKLAERLKNSKIPSWSKNFHLNTKNEKLLLTYLILLDSLNFCFWSKKKKWRIYYKGRYYNGYFGLSLALKKFFLENKKIANFNYFSKISFNQFSEILKGKGELLFLKKRHQIVKEVSKFFLREYQGDPLLFLKSAENYSSNLVLKIYQEVPFFQDVSFYNNFQVYFLKRAQILVSDIFGAFGGRGLGFFKDLDWLTAFPDYKLPQILNHFGVLKYHPELEKKIQQRREIPVFSKEEIEIRAGTILAVEYLRDALKRRKKSFFSFQIDWILWGMSQKIKTKNPYHLTKTIFY